MNIANTANTNYTSILVHPSRKTTRRRSHKRVVSFNSLAEVCILERSSTSSDEEDIDTSELWWRSRDYRQMKKQCLLTAQRKLDSDPALDDDADCECRGLERLLDSTPKSLVTNSISAVMREQTRQRLDGEEGEESDFALAELYGVYSRHSAIRARRLALFDAREARKVIRSDWHKKIQQENSQRQEQQYIPLTIESRLKSSRRHSLEALPLQQNIKITLATMVTRRRRAWI